MRSNAKLEAGILWVIKFLGFLLLLLNAAGETQGFQHGTGTQDALEFPDRIGPNNIIAPIGTIETIMLQGFDQSLQLKCADVLHVVGVGEHVNGLNLGKSVSVFNEVIDIACLRVGVARDVDDALRRQAAGRAKELFV